MLTININGIKSERESFASQVPGALFNPQDESLFEDVVDVAIQLYRTHEQLVIKGKALTKARLTCSRCLTAYQQSVEANLFYIVQQELSYKGHANKDTEDDDPAVIICHGDQLDLIPEIRSSLLLALPMKPLCKHACLGLCVNCGANMNSEACQCKRQSSATAFAELKNMVEKQNLK